jgi:DNA-binding transcriptional LysR family regulator
VDPRPDRSTIRRAASARTIPELLEAVASGRAVTIASELFADSYARRDLAFVRISDIEPSEVVLCTRREDPSPRTALLRRVVGNLDNRDACVGGQSEKSTRSDDQGR